MMRNYLWLVLLSLSLLPGCYHMRAEAEPIAERIITVTAAPAVTVRKIRALIEQEWHTRIFETAANGSVLITSPYRFAVDTGFGQPAGGRKYYTQLHIEIETRGGQTTVRISSYNFEMRSSYAFNQDGQVGTLYKHYPYEQYPGMFDLSLINNELDRVAAAILHLFTEYR